MAIIETRPASYKGVSFLMLTSNISGGRKDVLFEFANSDKQKIEDLGLRPRSYSVSAIIPHKDYEQTRNDLLRVLEDGVKGPLDHPFYGKVEDIVVRSFTIIERISDLGRAELTINFAVSNDIGTPSKSINAISEASLQADILNTSLTDDLATFFGVEESFLNNFEDAADMANDAADVYSEITAFATTLTDEINSYASLINDFSTNINQLIAVPQDFANSVQNIFSTLNGLFGSVEGTFNAFTSLSFLSFGDNGKEIQQSTAGRVQRAQNRDVFNSAMQTFSLNYAYLNATQIDFSTTEDIDAVSVTLEDQYNKVQQSTGVSLPGIASPPVTVKSVSEVTLSELTKMRTVVGALLSDKRAQARNVITINTKQMPMSVLAYRYYGSAELTNTLLALNNVKGASFIDGDVKILTV